METYKFFEEEHNGVMRSYNLNVDEIIDIAHRTLCSYQRCSVKSLEDFPSDDLDAFVKTHNLNPNDQIVELSYSEGEHEYFLPNCGFAHLKTLVDRMRDAVEQQRAAGAEATDMLIAVTHFDLSKCVDRLLSEYGLSYDEKLIRPSDKAVMRAGIFASIYIQSFAMFGWTKRARITDFGKLVYADTSEKIDHSYPEDMPIEEVEKKIRLMIFGKDFI